MFVGAALGLGMRLFGDVLRGTYSKDITSLTGLPIDILMGATLILQALIALATGQLSKLIDNKRLMIFSLGGFAAGLGLLSAGYGAVASLVILFLMLICLSTVNNGMVAFALTMVPKVFSGLTVGLFFSGLSGAIAIFGYLVPKTSTIPIQNIILFTAIAFLTAGVGIALGERITRKIVVD